MATKFKFAIDGKCAVTQLDNGSYSHAGSTAWDIASRDSSSYLGYSCNVPLVCKAVNKTYAFTWWQSTEKVQFANGDEDYIVIMCGHDSDINAYAGMTISANTRIGNMGTGGNATGAHVHIEFGKGSYKGTWYANSQGVYVLYNAVDFTDATFIDDLNFQTPTYTDVLSRWDEVKANFKYTTSTSSTTSSSTTTSTSSSTSTTSSTTTTEDEVIPCADIPYNTTISDYDKLNSLIESALIKIGGTQNGEPLLAIAYTRHFSKITVPKSVYYDSQADSTELAKAEAELVLNQLNGTSLQYPIFWRHEDPDLEVYQAFKEVIESAGYACGIYTDNQSLTSSLIGENVWLAKGLMAIQGSTLCFRENGTATLSCASGEINKSDIMYAVADDYPKEVVVEDETGGTMTISELLTELTTAITELETKVAETENLQTQIDSLQNQLDELNSKFEQIKEIVN